MYERIITKCCCGLNSNPDLLEPRKSYWEELKEMLYADLLLSLVYLLSTDL